MTWAHGLGAALLFLGSTAAGFALRRELQQRAQLLAAVIDSLQLHRRAAAAAAGSTAPHGGDGAGAAACAIHRPRRRHHGQRPAVLRAMGGGDPGTGHAHTGRAHRAADIGRAAWKI